jgi:subtilisin family serine protease
MKKLLLCGVLAAGCCLVSPAQSKINNVGRVQLNIFAEQRAELAKTSPARAAAYDPSVTVIATVKPGVSAADLEDAGFTVLSSADDMHIVKLPYSKVEALAASDDVKYVDFGYKVRPMMDVARQVSSVDACHAGSADEGLTQSYKGEGVYVGLYDTGVDPNHINFTDSNNQTRVKGIYVGRSGDVTSYLTDDEIASFSSDDRSETHGTHVLGIITGREDVDGQYGSKNGTQTTTANGNIPFYGVAPAADILVGCGDFDTSSINAGVGALVDRAASENRPIAVNLSLGSNNGPHDARETNCKFLDSKAKDAIICVSAGNEGGEQLSVEKTFRGSGSGSKLNTFIVPTTGSTAYSYYTAEFWSDTEQSFDCTLVLYNTGTKQTVTQKALSGTSGSFTWKATDDSNFSSAFTSDSQVRVSWGVDNATGRYNVYILGQMTSSGQVPVLFGVNIVGNNGQTLNGYCETYAGTDVKFSQEGVSGYTTGTDKGSINGMACGYNTISVGAWVSRTSMPTLGNSSATYNSSGNVGQIASFSSYGSAYGATGQRQLPTVCAPGAQIISSVSRYWVSANNYDKTAMNAYAYANGRDNHWYYMQGTSMSCPFVTGTMALWLQACPGMRGTEAQQIIAQTSDNDTNTASEPKRWGAGKLNVLKGLKAAIEMNASVKSVLADEADQNLMIANNGKQYEVSCAGVKNLSCTLHNLQGATVLAAQSADDTVNFDATNLQSGIYVLTVNAAGQKLSRKVVIK